MSILAFAFLLIAGATEIGTEKDGIIHVTPMEAADLVANHPNVQVLDVRMEHEFQEAHIKGAVQISYYAPNFRMQIAALPTDVPYLVHCRSGTRSSRAVRILQQDGVSTIYHLDGGLNAWQAAGLPVIQKEATP
ncbi:MAG: rhodanese-like domain-containing protein [Pseudomonadota bacterium]